MVLVNERGEIVKLGRELTTPGGEGSIYELASNSALVAKIYHSPSDQHKNAKLQHLSRSSNKALLGIAAWPNLLLFANSDRRTVRGFVMPRINGKEIHRLYGPRDRYTEFPSAAWDFLIHVARNCAAAFETLHENDVVMADVNEKNLLVTDNGEVRLIDCDSYQIKCGAGHFLCDVGVPLWTPPELQMRVQQKGYHGLERTPNHDRFGLAVLIFELLFMGRHPFAGVPTGTHHYEIHEAIQKYLFAFSSQTWQRGIKAPPHTLQLAALPQNIIRLFERAFLPSSERPNARPTGQEWAYELESLRASQKKCNYDPGHKFWNGLTNCPWCQLIGAGGPNFFISVAIHLGEDESIADVTIHWKAIQRVLTGDLVKKTIGSISLPIVNARAMPLVQPVLPKLNKPSPPPEPAPLPRPILLQPTFPPTPQMSPPAPLPVVPLGKHERDARLCLASSFFCLAACIVSIQLQQFQSAVVDGMVLFIFLAFLGLKINRATNERKSRQQAERIARQEERRKAKEEYEHRLIKYGDAVKKITEEHAKWVARAEAGYLHDQASLESNHRLKLSAYFAQLTIFENALLEYERDKHAWDNECKLRALAVEQSRREMNDSLERLRTTLVNYQSNLRNLKPKLDLAYQQFQKASADEILAMKALETKKREAQLRQFLDSKLIRDGKIKGIGKAKADTLLAYGIESALDITPFLNVPGIPNGKALFNNLLAWRSKCEANFRYNPNTPLPQTEVQAIKLKFAQARQSALIELRGGAGTLSSWEADTRRLLTNLESKMPQLTRAHAQALADQAMCT